MILTAAKLDTCSPSGVASVVPEVWRVPPAGTLTLAEVAASLLVSGLGCMPQNGTR
jgi:hypothetical protein